MLSVPIPGLLLQHTDPVGQKKPLRDILIQYRTRGGHCVPGAPPNAGLTIADPTTGEIPKVGDNTNAGPSRRIVDEDHQETAEKDHQGRACA